MRYQVVVEDSYLAFDETEFETEEDELKVNWCVFAARAFAVFLLICMIVSYSLGKIDGRFIILGSIIAGSCIVCLVGSFFECFQRRFFMSTYRQSSHPSALPPGFPRTSSKTPNNVGGQTLPIHVDNSRSGRIE
jgi:hypothetical protein